MQIRRIQERQNFKSLNMAKDWIFQTKLTSYKITNNGKNKQELCACQLFMISSDNCDPHYPHMFTYLTSRESFMWVQFSHCHVQLFANLWTGVREASLSITNSQSLFKLMSIELVMPFNYLILCHLLLLLPSIFPTITVFSNESVLHMRWPKYWSINFNISPSNKYS